MERKFKVITLCGSSKFKKEFIEIAEKLSLEGNIVISLGLFGHADNKFGDVITDEVKEMLDSAHKQKIEMSDAIYVINPGGYIGASTNQEIHYARALGKEIMFLEEPSLTFKGKYPSYIRLSEDLLSGQISPKNGDVCFIELAGGADIYGTPIYEHSFVAFNVAEGGFYKIDLTDAKITLKDQYIGDIKVCAGRVVPDEIFISKSDDNNIPDILREDLEARISEVSSIPSKNDNYPSPYPRDTLISKYKLRGIFSSYSELIERLMRIKNSLKHKDLFQVNGCDGGEDMYGTKLSNGDVIAWISKSNGLSKQGWMKISSENEIYVNGAFESFEELLKFFNHLYNKLPKIGDRFEILKAGGYDFDKTPIEAGDIVEYQLETKPNQHIWRKVEPKIIDLDNI